MPRDDSTRTWLTGRTDEQLQTLLKIRDDLRRGAPLADLDDLAARLEHPLSVSSVVTMLPRPAIEVLEALTALGEDTRLERLTELLDDGGRDAEEHEGLLRHWLHVLESVGLAWEVDERHAVNPGVHRVAVNPLLLGQPARQLTAHLTVDPLKRLYTGLGVTPPTRKAELLAGIGELYADRARIRRTLATAPDEVAATLTERISEISRASMAGWDAWEEDTGEDYWKPSQRERYQRLTAMNRWAAQHGLAIGDGSSYTYAYTPVQFPSEVMLALVPPSYRAPFHPHPPQVPTTQLSPVQIERDAAAAVTSTVAAVLAVLESLARTPVQQLKSGGVGSRELKRVAKSVGVEESQVRLALELGARLQCLIPGSELAAGEQFEPWRRQPPPERAADLLLTWWPLTVPPTLSRDEDAKARPALAGHAPGPLQPAPVLSTIIGSLDGAASRLEPVVERMLWARPLDRLSEAQLRCTWDEAAALGVIRDGQLTALGQALLTGEREQVVEQLREMLPDESTEVLFGSDLTVVAPGSAPAHVVDLLDTVGVRESHGVGATWRVSETSLRDALDRGYRAEVLREELETVAGQGLPQTLEYLLRDVDRQHGQVGVRPAGCVIVSEDSALLTELAATKALRSLGLTSVAPTVLVAATDVPTTLAAVRKAGYLPVEEDAGGARTVTLRACGPVGEHAREQAPEPEPRSGADPGIGDLGAPAGPSGDEDDDLLGLLDEEFNRLLETELLAPTRGPKHSAYRAESPEELTARLRSGQAPPPRTGTWRCWTN